MHFTHCVKHGPHYMMEYNQINCIYCTEQYTTSRLVEDGRNDGKKQTEKKAERALCTWIRVFPDASVCCFGLWGWKPGWAPTAEVHSGNQSLYLVNAAEVLPTVRACVFSHPLICLVHPSPWMTTAVAAEIFLKRCWCKCLQRHQLTLWFPPPLTHSDRRDGAGGSEKQDPDRLSPQGPSVLTVLSNFV